MEYVEREREMGHNYNYGRRAIKFFLKMCVCVCAWNAIGNSVA